MDPGSAVISVLQEILQVVRNSEETRNWGLPPIPQEAQPGLQVPLRGLLDSLEDQRCFGGHTANGRQAQVGGLATISHRTAGNVRSMAGVPVPGTIIAPRTGHTTGPRSCDWKACQIWYSPSKIGVHRRLGPCVQPTV